MTKDEYRLIEIVRGNTDIEKILERAGELNVPNWYLGGGAVAQTVWNHLHGFAPTHGIKDYDLVYFDDSDLSEEVEEKTVCAGKKLFSDISNSVEIANQARVHHWYKETFGESVEPFNSSEDAIDHFLTIAGSVGVRCENDICKIYAPFGLDDIFEMVLRPNYQAYCAREAYQKKIARYTSVWHKLTIVPWEEENKRG